MTSENCTDVYIVISDSETDEELILEQGTNSSTDCGKDETVNALRCKTTCAKRKNSGEKERNIRSKAVGTGDSTGIAVEKDYIDLCGDEEEEGEDTDLSIIMTTGPNIEKRLTGSIASGDMTTGRHMKEKDTDLTKVRCHSCHHHHRNDNSIHRHKDDYLRQHSRSKHSSDSRKRDKCLPTGETKPQNDGCSDRQLFLRDENRTSTRRTAEVTKVQESSIDSDSDCKIIKEVRHSPSHRRRSCSRCSSHGHSRKYKSHDRSNSCSHHHDRHRRNHHHHCHHRRHHHHHHHHNHHSNHPRYSHESKTCDPPKQLQKTSGETDGKIHAPLRSDRSLFKSFSGSNSNDTVCLSPIETDISKSQPQKCQKSPSLDQMFSSSKREKTLIPLRRSLSATEPFTRRTEKLGIFETFSNSPSPDISGQSSPVGCRAQSPNPGLSEPTTKIDHTKLQTLTANLKSTVNKMRAVLKINGNSSSQNIETVSDVKQSRMERHFTDVIVHSEEVECIEIYDSPEAENNLNEGNNFLDDRTEPIVGIAIEFTPQKENYSISKKVVKADEVDSSYSVCMKDNDVVEKSSLQEDSSVQSEGDSDSSHGAEKDIKDMEQVSSSSSVLPVESVNKSSERLETGSESKQNVRENPTSTSDVTSSIESVNFTKNRFTNIFEGFGMQDFSSDVFAVDRTSSINTSPAVSALVKNTPNSVDSEMEREIAEVQNDQIGTEQKNSLLSSKQMMIDSDDTKTGGDHVDMQDEMENILTDCTSFSETTVNIEASCAEDTENSNTCSPLDKEEVKNDASYYPNKTEDTPIPLTLEAIYTPGKFVSRKRKISCIKKQVSSPKNGAASRTASYFQPTTSTTWRRGCNKPEVKESQKEKATSTDIKQWYPTVDIPIEDVVVCPLPQNHVSVILGCVEEGSYFLGHGLDYVQNFCRKYKPPETIINEIVKSAFLTKGTDLILTYKAYEVLRGIVKKYPGVMYPDWKTVDHCLNCSVYKCTSGQEDGYESSPLQAAVLLKLSLHALKMDLYNRNLKEPRDIRKSAAYKILAYDCSSSNLKTLIHFTQSAVMAGEYEEVCESSAHLPNTGDCDGDEKPKTLPMLQELFELAVNVSSSCEDSANYLASELIRGIYVYLPTSDHKHLLLQTTKSELLQFKLIQKILESQYSGTFPLCSFPDTVKDIVECFFQAVPLINPHTPPTTPSDEQDLDTYSGSLLEPSACEEIAMLLYFNIKSYIKCKKKKSCISLRRRPWFKPGKLEVLGSHDVPDLEELSQHVDDLHRHLLTMTSDLTATTEQYLMMMCSLAEMNSDR